MPVRSLTSSVLKWPDLKEVDISVKQWAKQQISQHPEVIKIGYYGSYARNDWSVGSDLDLIILVKDTEKPFNYRSLEWNVTDFPVPADLVIYTLDEWKALLKEGRFGQVLLNETVWVYKKS